MPELSINLSCPSCGGALSMEEGAKLTNCKYCDALLGVEGEGGVFKTTFKSNVAEQQATGVLKNWFGKGLKARDLTARAAITELYPIYLPFWRMSARAAGWVCGYEERRRTDSQGRVHVERIDMERMVLRDFEWSQIACDAGDLGIKSLRNLRGEALLHEEGSIPTFEATTSATDARSQGETSIRNMARQSANVPKITFEKIHVVPRYLGLVFYPVWIGRYEYAGRSYFATVDGVTGQTISGRAPGDPLYRAAIMTGGSAAGGIMTGIGGMWGLAGSDIGWALVVAGLIVFGLSWMFFRHGSEVVEGDIPKAYLGGLNISKLNVGGVQP
ncbi:MAG: hypothetical protein FJ149_06010 [Euryarchaeota archaeon]|nr:hypothetical protein [Euryarchaeota archaeon]